MKPGMIDSSQIQSMMAKLKAIATGAQPEVGPVRNEQVGGKLDFASALKASLDQVAATQHKAEHMGQRFMLGDDSVNLSDVMIAMQKANIEFQGTVQVRNKLVSAYQDIMNMQV